MIDIKKFLTVKHWNGNWNKDEYITEHQDKCHLKKRFWGTNVLCAVQFECWHYITFGLITLLTTLNFFNNKSGKCLKITVLIIDGKVTFIPHHFIPSVKSLVSWHCFGSGLIVSWWITAIMVPSPITNVSFFFLFPAPVYSSHHWIFSLKCKADHVTPLYLKLFIRSHHLQDHSEQDPAVSAFPSAQNLFLLSAWVISIYFSKHSLSHSVWCSFCFPETVLIIPSSLLACMYLHFASITLQNLG